MPAASPLSSIPAEQEARLVALLCGQDVDSEGLAAVAARAGVAGAVAHLLGDAHTLSLQELAHQQGLFWIRRVGQALDDARVPFLILKGVPLSERYYRPHFLRACGDLDVLIDPADFQRAHEAVLQCGYLPSTAEYRIASRFLGHHYNYSHLAAPTLELHFRLQSFFGNLLAAKPFLNRSVVQTLSNGCLVRVLAPVDEFVHLAAHAAVHKWMLARWLYDLVLLLTHHPDLDWDLVAARTGETHLWPPVLLTCAVLEEEWQTRVPLAALVPARYERARRSLPAFRRKPWDGSNWAKSQYVFHDLALCQGPMEKSRFLVRCFSYPLLRRLKDGLG